jgi:hypothetical protein
LAVSTPVGSIPTMNSSECGSGPEESGLVENRW